MQFDCKKDLIASGDRAKSIRILDTKAFKCIISLEGQSEEVLVVQFISSYLPASGKERLKLISNKLLASWSADKLWSYRQGEVFRINFFRCLSEWKFW